MNWFYPTAFTSWGPEEGDAMMRVIASGRFTMGEEVAAFEQELAAFHGVKHAIMVNSGSSANLIAVAALFHIDQHPLRRGDRVIVPALAWPTLYSPLVQHGLTLCVVDADDTWNMKQEPMTAVNDAALVVGCPILGNPGHQAYWRDRAQRSGAIFIEDACESFGAAHDGKFCGTFGRMGTLSFYFSHQLSAIEGGAIITDDDECAELCRMLRNHGWTKGTMKQPIGFAGEYDFRLMGYNVRPLELHAAIAREQLKKTAAFGRERNRNLCAFIDAVESWAKPGARVSPIGMPQILPESLVNPFGIAFTVKDSVTRSKLAAQFREAGIDCRPPVGGSLRRHPYGQRWKDQETPNADLIHDTGIFIGNAPFNIQDKIATAVQIIEDVL